MQFRPCIDIHNGKVKQIVVGSLKDEGNKSKENFVSECDASYFADLYKKENLKGAHVIMLNAKDSEYYEATKAQATLAVQTFPGALQVGGGITAENAAEYIANGADKVIVTSYVFKDGEIQYDNLQKLIASVGKEHIVLDLSCRKKEGKYYIVTDRWQKFTNVEVTHEVLGELSSYCSEFLIHAVDVEGKQQGIDTQLIAYLGKWDGIPITYAGGIHTYEDIETVRNLGQGKIHVTVGSALDLFGGSLEFDKLVQLMR
ncbi:MAG: phosphoribosylformimino-5-aminoimidazole carboxamide ribotide isomerase [Lachnospiraceae bacterium]|nr:phosphoribosylformimino-5-aminoimidazole carboxamide ribotide isomerase [Lachnospiraceae bacterium]